MTIVDATRIAKGSTYLVTQSIATAGIRAVGFVFIARILTQTEMGIVVALTLMSTLAQLLSDLGLSSGLSKYIAEYRGRNQGYSPLLFSGISVKLLTGSIVAIICASAAPQLSTLLLRSGDYTVLFQLLSVYVLVFCINMTMTSLLLGLDKIREMAILNIAITSVGQISAVAFLMFGWGLMGLIGGWILGNLAYLIPSVLVIAKGKHFRKHSFSEVQPFLKTLAKFSWPLFLTNIVIFAYSAFDQAILLAYLPLGEVAVYSVALRVFTVLSVIPTALNTTLFPYYSEQYGRNKSDSIIIGARAATRYIALIYLPLALGLMVTANPAIDIFAGSTYVRGDAILSILCLFGAISSLKAAFGNLLFVYEMTQMVLLIDAASIGASIALSPILLPSLGVAGMAFLKGVAMILSLILTIFVLRRRMQIEFDKEALWKGWTAAVIMFVAVGVIEYMFFSRYLLVLYIVVGGFVYVMALRIMKGVNQGDILLIRNLMGKRGAFIPKVLERVFI